MNSMAQVMRIVTIGILSLTLISCGDSSDGKPSSSENFLACLFTLFILCRDTPAETTDGVRFSASIIQDQIDSANSGDTIRVAPGTYLGSIDFRGKAIKLVSDQGPLFTIIDGDGSDSPIVSFSNAEGLDSILDGFTIQNGRDKGIYAKNASPTIVNNIITNIEICDGAGIELNNSSAILRRNTIRDNTAICVGDRAGGAIIVRGYAAAVIDENTIIDNSSIDLAGGITLWDAGTPTIKNNTINGNLGGAIKIRNRSDALILQNIISNNTDEDCGGIDWRAPINSTGPRVINNTLVNNDGRLGSSICADGYDDKAQLVNNIMVSKGWQTAIFCGDFQGRNFDPPVVRFNNVFAPSGIAYGGVCTEQTGMNGNISADPLFLDALNGNYQLTLTSTAIDAGDSSLADLPATDITGSGRIADGDFNTISQVDLGAFEFAH